MLVLSLQRNQLHVRRRIQSKACLGLDRRHTASIYLSQVMELSGILPVTTPPLSLSLSDFGTYSWLLCCTPNHQGRRQVGSVMSDLALALRQQRHEQATRAFPLFR